ncbi:MAG: hypothetical protein K9M14_01905 [Candidatus Omnitrophica bacterium]|nr:hypothetical protein [Candidatus Omnitrophota bacterium]
MKHLSKKELILFYYRELEPKKTAVSEAHLQICPKCRKELNQLKEQLSQLNFKPVDLENGELNQIISQVKEKACQAKGKAKLFWLKDYFSNFARGLGLFFLKPKTALVAVSLFLFLFAVYFYGNQNNNFSANVLAVEVDLVADDEFDILLDSYNSSSQSYISSSRVISS